MLPGSLLMLLKGSVLGAESTYKTFTYTPISPPSPTKRNLPSQQVTLAGSVQGRMDALQQANENENETQTAAAEHSDSISANNLTVSYMSRSLVSGTVIGANPSSLLVNSGT